MYGYLLITENSLPMLHLIAADYHASIHEMLSLNEKKKKNYSCSVICLNCSWYFRYRLAQKTGIPFKKIQNVKQLEHKKFVKSLECIVDCDSFMDDTFLGKIKIYDNVNNVNKADINPCLEIEYA